MGGFVLSLAIFCLCLHHSHQYKEATDTHFDVIVLSQEWAVSVCLFYKLESHPGGGCWLPKQKNHWTIHGIWPRTIEGKYIEFCNEKWAFDPKNIRPIENKLHVAQISVYKEDIPYTFWAWEWRRHGTCAALFEPFNTQLKFFSKSIEWNQKYAVGDMLAAAHIFPDDRQYLDPEVIAEAVKAKTGKDPMIGCYVIDGVPYLQEVRICLDKKFNLMDCKLQVVDKYCRSPRGLIYPATEFAHRALRHG